MEDLKTLMARQEELAEELQAHVIENSMGGEMLNHPLVQSIFYFPQQNAMYNAQLKAKREAIAEAIKYRHFSQYIWLFERPYRFDAFKDIAGSLEYNEYWDTLSSVWSDSENIWQNKEGWIELLQADIPKRQLLMSSFDEHYFNQLTDKLEIHRGYDANKGDAYGLSFSLDKEKALWFANRFGNSGEVRTITINKKDAIAYLSTRSEQEIIYIGK